MVVLVGLLCLINYLLLEAYDNHEKNHKWVQISEMPPFGLAFLLLVYVAHSIHPKDARPQISNPPGGLQAPCHTKSPVKALGL